MNWLLDNPIFIREWRVLLRRASDWRIWVGLKWTLDPVVWGAPVILTYALGPYALWAMLWFLEKVRLIPPAGLPLDPFFMLALVLWVYVVVISLVLGAMTVSGERERQTWEQLLVTPLTARERVAGFLWGRLGPVWVSFTVTACLWWIAQPIGSGWLAHGLQPRLSRTTLAEGEALILYLSVLVGEIGLLASALCGRTSVAVGVAALMAAPFALVVWLVVAALLLSNGDVFVTHSGEGAAPGPLVWLIFFWFLISLPAVIIQAAEKRLDGRHREFL